MVFDLEVSSIFSWNIDAKSLCIPSFLPTPLLITTSESPFLHTIPVVTPDCLWMKDLQFQMWGKCVFWPHKDLSKIRALDLHLRSRWAAYLQTSEQPVAPDTPIFGSRHSGCWQPVCFGFNQTTSKSIPWSSFEVIHEYKG